MNHLSRMRRVRSVASLDVEDIHFSEQLYIFSSMRRVRSVTSLDMDRIHIYYECKAYWQYEKQLEML